jgi:hypothetical protein
MLDTIIIIVQSIVIYSLIGYINYKRLGSFYIVNFCVWPLGLLAELITGEKNFPPDRPFHSRS